MQFLVVSLHPAHVFVNNSLHDPNLIVPAVPAEPLMVTPSPLNKEKARISDSGKGWDGLPKDYGLRSLLFRKDNRTTEIVVVF